MGGPSRPKFASLFVTRKCNLTCPYCHSILHDYEDIKTEEWKKIIDRLHGWGVRVFSLTGGEPTVRHDIHEIIRYISREKKSVCWMISNFKTMKREKILRLKESGLEFLTCSLDSLEGGEAVKSDSGVYSLLEYAKKLGMLCTTLTVVSKKNLHEIPLIMEESIKRGIVFDMGLYQHVGGIFSPGDDKLKVTDYVQLEEMRKMLRKWKLKTGLVAPSWGYLNESLDYYKSLSWKCSNSTDHYLVVNNDGRLMTCQEYLNDVHVLEIESLEDPRWRSAKKETVDKCDGCFYGCYYQKENVSAKDAALDAYAMLKA